MTISGSESAVSRLQCVKDLRRMLPMHAGQDRTMVGDGFDFDQLSHRRRIKSGKGTLCIVCPILRRLLCESQRKVTACSTAASLVGQLDNLTAVRPSRSSDSPPSFQLLP